jgi:hypothetical protein
MESIKLQAPSFREAPIFKFQTGRRSRELKLGAWNFSGAWMLVLGDF